jgi:hypothetical protein
MSKKKIVWLLVGCLILLLFTSFSFLFFVSNTSSPAQNFKYVESEAKNNPQDNIRLGIKFGYPLGTDELKGKNIPGKIEAIWFTHGYSSTLPEQGDILYQKLIENQEYERKSLTGTYLNGEIENLVSAEKVIGFSIEAKPNDISSILKDNSDSSVVFIYRQGFLGWLHDLPFNLTGKGIKYRM